jgi:DnaK suppressor protein
VETVAKAKAKTNMSKKKATKNSPAKKKVVIKSTAKKASKKNAVSKKSLGKKKPTAKSIVKKKVVKSKASVKKKVEPKKKAPAKKTTKKKMTSKAAPVTKKPVTKKPVTKKASNQSTKATAKTAAKAKSTKPGATARRSAPAATPRPRIIRKIINLKDVKIGPDYKPSAKEQYMSPKHLAYFKRKLDGWRDELIIESEETLEHLRTETRDVGDEAERASRESDNILELRTRDRYRKLLRKIEEALKRVEEGAYGYCEETGEEIGLGRLEARPIATLTVDAQERREMFQKQFRDDR